MNLYFNFFLFFCTQVLFALYVWRNDLRSHSPRWSIIHFHYKLFLTSLPIKAINVWLLVRLVLYKVMKRYKLIHCRCFFLGYLSSKIGMLIIEEFIFISIFIIFPCSCCVCPYFLTHTMSCVLISIGINVCIHTPYFLAPYGVHDQSDPNITKYHYENNK